MKFWLLAPIMLASLCAPVGATDSPTQPMGALADTTHAPGPTDVVVTSDCDGNVQYCPSADQLRVDRSFSDIAIDSAPQPGVLTEDQRDGCEQWGECDWLDSDKVRHYLWGDGPNNLYVVVKTVTAADFTGRSISALGIGTARKQADVLANVRAFLPNVKIDCDGTASGNVGPVECGGTLNPGWFQIGFDREGNLLAVRFDGYQFT